MSDMSWNVPVEALPVTKHQKASVTMKCGDVLRTGEIAKLCQVSVRTVSKWIDEGLLKGYRIPGSTHRRVAVEEFERFTREHGLMLAEEKTA